MKIKTLKKLIEKGKLYRMVMKAPNFKKGWICECEEGYIYTSSQSMCQFCTQMNPYLVFVGFEKEWDLGIEIDKEEKKLDNKKVGITKPDLTCKRI